MFLAGKQWFQLWQGEIVTMDSQTESPSDRCSARGHLMPGYVEDRWYKKGPPDPVTKKPTRIETARCNQGKRYKVSGIPGVRSRSFERLTGPRGANAWLAKAQHESTSGEFVDPRRGDILLKDYIEQEWWPSKGYEDPATAKTVRSRIWTHVIPYLGDLQLNAIKAPQLKRWLADAKGTAGQGTISEAWTYLAAVLQAAVDDERITKNYCRSQRSVRPPSRPSPKPRAWNKERVVAVREAIDPRFRLAVDIGVGAGLRAGEVFGLAWRTSTRTANASMCDARSRRSARSSAMRYRRGRRCGTSRPLLPVEANFGASGCTTRGGGRAALVEP